MKKGQSSLEASIILGVLMIFFIFFIIAIGRILTGASDESLANDISHTADRLESELRNAAYYEDGFVKNISLPADIRGSDYTVEFSNRSMTRQKFTQIRVSSSRGHVAVRQLPANIEGAAFIPKGENITIRKLGGTLGICPGKTAHECVPTPTRWFQLITQTPVSPPSLYFESNWDTTKTGSSSSTQITLPLYNGGRYNFTVYWGDGNVKNVTSL